MIKTKQLAGLLTTKLALIILLSAPSQPVFAQDGAALEELVVTARKREENVLEVPLSITALTADNIEAKGIGEFKDMIAFTPGFHFAEHSVGRADRSNRILVIRGMHISQENDHQQAATVFVDGAPMHGSVIAGLEDAERIEVVRGPQSAYFGRATLSGAVNFVTKTPGQESKGKVVAEFGKYGTRNLGASFEGPLSDTVSYRVALSSQDTDGQYKAANDPSLTLGERSTTSFAGTLYFEPNDRFNAKVRFHTWEDDDGPGAAFGYGVNNGEELFDCNLPNSRFVLLKAPSAWRILVPVPQTLDDKAIKSNDYVSDIFRRVLNSSDPIETIHRTIYRVHQRVVNKMRYGRIMLAGDSAHLNNPLGGFGMNGGLHDAWNLAEKLDGIINHKKDEDLLNLYDRQRRTVMNDFIQKQTIRNKKMIEETGDANYSSEWMRMRNLHENENERRDYMLRQSMTQSLINEAAIK